MVKSNQRGYISFAKTNMPHSRSVQFFINYKDNGNLDSYGFSPFGRVIEGMEVVDSVYKGYGEGAPQGRGTESGADSRRRQRLSQAGFRQAGLHQEGDAAELSRSFPPAAPTDGGGHPGILFST